MQIKVPPSAIDEREHVNNLVYLEWCIEIATQHWKARATVEMQEQLVWYVLQHTISYKAAAFQDDEIEVSTWITFAKGVKSERAFEIRRKKDNELLAEAKTLWCLLDAKTLRPTEVSEEIRTLFV
ncbi:MAG: acyl-CoA thioesterase [Flavobacteriaceae bacterium]|nr:acyl-CoA thioesterase [Flavobacteriaceae bacterium]